MNADIGEACWRRGAFVDFSVTDWIGWDGMVRRAISRDTRRDVGGGGGREGGGEFWERVHVLNRLVREYAGIEKNEGRAFLSALFCLLRWLIPGSST